MAGDARDGLIRVVYLGRISALMMAAGAVLSEAALLALDGTAHHRETLMVGSTAIVFVSVVLLPMSLRLPARLRRTYDAAAPIESVVAPRDGQDAVRRLSLWRTAGFVGVMACWLLFHRPGVRSSAATDHAGGACPGPVGAVPGDRRLGARERGCAVAGRPRAAGAPRPCVPRAFRRRGPRRLGRVHEGVLAHLHPLPGGASAIVE